MRICFCFFHGIPQQRSVEDFLAGILRKKLGISKSQTLNAWHLYLHLPYKLSIHVGKYTSPIEYLGIWKKLPTCSRWEWYTVFPHLSCQVRVVRFYVSLLLLLLFFFFSSFVVVLSALKRQPPPSFLVVVLSALYREPPCPVFPAGPQPLSLSVPCRTSTAR